MSSKIKTLREPLWVFTSLCKTLFLFNQASHLQSEWQGCFQFLVNKLANYGYISKFKVSMETSWWNLCMYVCVYVCTYVYKYGCMYICRYVCMYVCMYICKYVSMYVCLYVYIYIYMYVCLYVCLYVCMDVYMYIFIYVYMYVCMYVCVVVFLEEGPEGPFSRTHRTLGA